MGYILNDNTASGGEKFESDTTWCRHCQAVLHISRWKKEGGWCFQCGASVCHPCSVRMQTVGCEPFIKKVDEALTRIARRKALVG